MKKILATLLTLTVFSLACPAEELELKYVLTTKNGLTSSDPTCFHQTKDSSLWIGTWNGLNSYDGSDFKVFRFNPRDDNSISNNVIRSVKSQNDGTLWIATDYGINRIGASGIPVSSYYLGYEHTSPLSINWFNLAISSEDRVFASSRDWGIAHYDENSGKMVSFNIPGFNTSSIKEVFCDSCPSLLLQDYDGNCVKVDYKFDESGSISILGVCSLLPDVKIMKSFNCGSHISFISEKEIFLYDKEAHAIECSFPLPVNSLVLFAGRYSDNELIISFNNLETYRMSRTDGTCSRIPSLCGKKVTTVYRGSEDILWAGIDGEGVEAYYDESINIKKFTTADVVKNRINAVTSFAEDSKGSLYFGTSNSGIMRLNEDGSVLIIDSSSGLKSNSVCDMAAGLNDDVFIGLEGGPVQILSLANHRFSSFAGQNGVPIQNDLSLCFDKERMTLWLGLLEDGLARLDLEWSNGTYRIADWKTYVNNPNDSLSISNNGVLSLSLAGDGDLWAGTMGGGLNYLDSKTGTFTHFTLDTPVKVSSNAILCLYSDSASSVWVGTGSGLSHITKAADGTFSSTNYNEDDGLKDSSIHGILEDENGTLWLSTNNGLSSFDVKSGQFNNYYNKSFLQNEEFKNHSCLRNSKGVMYFGGVNGFNYFSSAVFSQRDYTPELVINGFSIRQNKLENFDPSKTVTLKSNENFFNIKYAAIEFIDNSSVEYSYQLEGFDKDWINAGTNHIATYTNVPPGKYLFKVRSTNGDMVWRDNVRTLEITIRKQWWNTSLAYSLYIVILLFALFLARKRILKDEAQRHSLELAQANKKQQKETYEAKLDFFTNVAHEFGTPLTLITGSSEQLVSYGRLDKRQNEYVSIINNSADRMQRLIRELMEFRKIETGSYSLKFSGLDVIKLMRSVLDNFSEMAEDNRIKVETHFPDGPYQFVSDYNALDKIFNNLISNAFKFTPEGGEIILALDRGAEGNLLFSISNSGKGIKPEKIKSVFDRFTILDNFEQQAMKGRTIQNGIGLALVKRLVDVLSGQISVNSELNKQTTFSLSIPSAEGVVSLDPEEETHNNKLSAPSAPETQIEVEPQNARADSQTVMIVDDDKQIRNLVTDILGGEYNILQAQNGEEAISVLKTRRPDIIITDIIMPRINGIELVKKLKDNEITRMIPIVFLTFQSDIESEVGSYDLGTEAFIPKPFYPKQLKSVVHRILNVRSDLKKYYNSAVSNIELYGDSAIPSEDKDFLVKLTRIIDENLTDERLSGEFLCEKMNISKMKLYRKLKELTSMSISSFIRSIKLKHSAHLLDTTKLTVLEVMYESGFNYKSYFFKEFLAMYGMSPKEYRERGSRQSD